LFKDYHKPDGKGIDDRWPEQAFLAWGVGYKTRSRKSEVRGQESQKTEDRWHKTD
jgi:hypothetical protein